jgi:NADH-quinone oxidoreductase subunit G
VPIIFVDNVPFEVKPKVNLLTACLSLGFNLPYFCWHPALNSIGACRLCAVKQFRNESDTRGKIVMSCMTPAAEGTRISINDPDAVKFRKSVIEWLMVNHPHDCPICDEGGECHLQDMTLLTGHVYRRFRFKKRTYHNQYLGPFINHEMNRCIQCYRCVRFYCDYAGGRDLNVFAWHDHVYFGRQKEGVLENDFSGNLVEVCPTGVFTDKTFKKHYTRKWDLQTAPSVCIHCSLGCNTSPGERHGMLRRIRNRYNGEVNGYFLCDRGRFGYEFVNHPNRIRTPLSKRDGNLQPVSREEVLNDLRPLIQSGPHVIGIGSPRASVETNFALRALVGPANFYIGIPQLEFQLISRILNILQNGLVPSASLREIERADAVLVLGENLSETAPMAALALRQSVLQKPLTRARQMKLDEWHDMAVREAIQDHLGPLFLAVNQATKLDDIATDVYRATPDDIARLGFAVAHELHPKAPRVSDLPAAVSALAKHIAETLKNAERPLVISGTGCMNLSVLDAAAAVANTLVSQRENTRLFFISNSCNSLGAFLVGGKPIEAAIGAAEKGLVDTAIVVENDLYHSTGPELSERLLNLVGKTIVIDSLANRTTERADIVLPAAPFSESEGTLVNNEGRGQRFFKVLAPEGDVQESWRWSSSLLSLPGGNHFSSWKMLDELISDIAAYVPGLASLPNIAPPAGYRLSGQKVPRQPHRYSGRTAMHANINVDEPQPVDDPDSPLAFSMEGYKNQPPSSLISNFWAPHWNSVQSVNKFQSEINGPLVGGDPGVRMIEPKRENGSTFSDNIPDAFKPRTGWVLVLPAYHAFGSDELSNLAPGIAQLSPAPYISLRKADADAIAASESDVLELKLSGRVQRLILQIDELLPEGTAAVPKGLIGLPWDGVPKWYELKTMKKVQTHV